MQGMLHLWHKKRRRLCKMPAQDASKEKPFRSMNWNLFQNSLFQVIKDVELFFHALLLQASLFSSIVLSVFTHFICMYTHYTTADMLHFHVCTKTVFNYVHSEMNVIRSVSWVNWIELNWISWNSVNISPCGRLERVCWAFFHDL